MSIIRSFVVLLFASLVLLAASPAECLGDLFGLGGAGESFIEVLTETLSGGMGESVTSEIVSDTPPSMPMEETPAPAQMASTETMGSSLASLAPSSDVPSTAGVDAMGSSLASLGPSSDDPAPQMDVLAPAQFVSTSGGISGGSSVSSTQTPQASGTLRANDFSAPAASEEPKDFLAYIRGGGVRTGGQRGFGGFGSQIGATRDRANGAAPALAYSFPSFGGPQQRPFVFG